MAESPKPPSNLTDSSAATGGLENKGGSTAQYGAMVKDGSKIAGDANDALDEKKSPKEREQSKEELKQGIAENGPAFGGAAIGAVGTRSPEGAAVGYGIGKEVGKATAPVTRQVVDPVVDVAVDKGSEIKGKLKESGVPTDEATKVTRGATQGSQQIST